MSFLLNVVVRLGINHGSNISNYDNSSYNLDELIYRYNNHPSILSLKKISGFNSTFSFNKVDPDKISFEIQNPMIYLQELLRSSIAFFKNFWLTILMNVLTKVFSQI